MYTVLDNTVYVEGQGPNFISVAASHHYGALLPCHLGFTISIYNGAWCLQLLK